MIYVTAANSKCTPTKKIEYDAGYDLFACIDKDVEIEFGKVVMINTGAKIMLPKGYVAIVKDRSSLAMRGVHVIGGVIDPGYVGEIKVLLTKVSNDGKFVVKPYTRIAQLLIIKLADDEGIRFVSEETFNKIYKYAVNNEEGYGKRGEKGFGSTGLR